MLADACCSCCSCCCCCCCSCSISCCCGGVDLDTNVVFAVPVNVVPTVVVLVPTESRSRSRAEAKDSVRDDDDGLETCLRRPLTPIPNAPVREGPKIVCVCLRPVAPGKPEMLRGLVVPVEVGSPPLLPPPSSDSSGESGGLGDVAPSSGHFVGSAREAAVMYGFVGNVGLKEIRRGP